MIVEQVLENKTNYDVDKESEKPIRSVVKSISWRAVGTLDTILISWIITGQVKTALSIGGIELVTKMLLYFFHERVWNSIKWGKK
ncbi:Uncharacterized membrane protein [Tenacibaculum sp. MAR_2009_124]|uniref:DUF2061 domain-containing protein n=1 Tax=Tenacibaculum sp. MAR_2009_124 TaxID=1250059 RepID=UPI00089B6CCF|nr:DUF2061 domain-containing protein [Tenacibaculum sp. MAR_2009_124]SED06195.1 Uncharacterized membrane protein [Tenacibaculum sp. MAR_2009_124]